MIVFKSLILHVMKFSFLVFLFLVHFSMEVFSQQLEFDWTNSMGSEFDEQRIQ